MNRFGSKVILFGIVLLMAHTASANTVLFSTGFEAPEYAIGRVQGQNGWGGSPNSGHVHTPVSNGGTQAVEVESVGLTGQHLGGRAIGYDSAGNTEKIVTIGIDIMLTSLGSGPYWEGPFAFGTGGFISQLIVSNWDGRISGAGGFGPLLTTGVWNRIELTLNFAAQTASGFLNGTLFATESFWQPRTDITYVGGFGINSGPEGTDANAFYDNFSVVSSVPEINGSQLGIGLTLLLSLVLLYREREGFHA